MNENIDEISDSQRFIFKAELTEDYLDDGHINVNDMKEAEQLANSRHSLSDNAFTMEDSYPINNEAGEEIKEAILNDNYHEKGFIDAEDMLEAEREAFMQGTQEEMEIVRPYDDHLTNGGELIQDSLDIDNYLNNETFLQSELEDSVDNAESDGHGIDDSALIANDSPYIEDLFL